MELTNKYYRQHYLTYTRKLYYLVPKVEFISWVEAFENLILKVESSYSPRDIDRAVTAILQCISKGVLLEEERLQIAEGLPFMQQHLTGIFTRYEKRVLPSGLREVMLRL